MRSESLRETLSALMDDEAEQLELRRVLHAGEQDPDVRRSWERYQLARSVMHKEPWQPGVDLSAGIAAALADEPVPAIAPTVAPTRWKMQLGRVAVAASVTLAVLVGVRMINQDGMPDTNTMAAVERTAPAAGTPAMAAASAQARPGAVLAGFSSHADQAEPQQAAGPSAWQEQRIGSYLRRHAENSAQAAPNLVPYARAASLENN